ncbi:T9SS C-terminal target domain-containing protein [Chryseobacterium nematophagum]|uniref:T9SS C-terminal target domain-containing protein n=1 Tax=Chryseobacterium nematophagum TaxID=2305228 RepID=A0A3M7LCA9_9FLAO|nr:T9SS type A sorting domain-containing protein [Chryseobacterium nematophagum]RMZ59715.1 T9SS C-terminal target domain-containing protein [Chryseobacterium nematophagum]
MRKKNLSILLVCATSFLCAQEVIWEKDIPSSTQDFLSQVTPTIDGQYLITGSSIQTSTLQTVESKQSNSYDFHLVKLNQQGEEVWEKYFSGKSHDFLSAAVATQEGGFLLAGTSYSGKGLDKKEESKGGSDIWLIRINEFGDELWQKTVGSGSDEESRAVIQTTDLGFFVAGNTQHSPKGYGSKDVLVIRLDKNGKERSQMIFGGKGSDEIERIIPTKDGGALLGIYSRSGASGSKKTDNYGEGDYLVIKLDKDSKIQWEKNFGGSGDDHLRTLALTSQGFLIGGESRSGKSGNKSVGIEEGTDLWILSLNDKGEEIWQKSYNVGNRDVLMGMSVIHKNQGITTGIVLGGYTQAEGKIEKDDETFWLIYMDENGKEEWRKHVKGESRKREERLSDIKLNRDGSIVLAGTSAEEFGKENWKIIKLGDKQLNELIEKQDIWIYPNPASDYTYVEIGSPFKEAEITIYDMGGRQIQQTKTKNPITKINTQPLIQGAYLVVIKTDTHTTANAKLIKK